MSLSLGISHLALLTPPSKTITRQSVYSSSSLQIWQQKNFTGFRFRVRPNSRGGNFTIKDSISAAHVANEGELAEEGFVHYTQAGHRGAASGAPPRRTDGKFWRRFPGPAQGGAQDLTVPSEALRRGAVFRGVVSSVQAFGAFVTFGAFADGLIHISKLSSGYVKDVNDVVELGQEVMVRILNVEEATGRISLGVVEHEETDRRKSFVSPRREEARQRARFQAGSGRPPAFSTRGKEERAPMGAYTPSSRSMDFRESGEGSRQSLHPRPEEGQERVSRVPYASSTRKGVRRGGGGQGGGELTRFQQGSGRRSPFVGEEEEKNVRKLFASTGLGEPGEEEGRMSRNTFASSRQREDGKEDGMPRNSIASSKQRGAGGEERMSRNPLASSREREAGEDDSMPRNSFASHGQQEAREEERVSRNRFVSSGQSETGEEGRMSRNSSALSRQKEDREEGSSPRFQQGHDGKFLSRGRFTRVSSGADGEEQTSPRRKLVDILSDENVEDKAVDGKGRSPMRSVMRSWFECECCY